MVFPVLAMPRLYTVYDKDQLLQESLEMAVRRVGGWCEVVPSCEDVSSEAEERPLSGDVTKQCNEDRD
jgi:hypothetical protein